MGGKEERKKRRGTNRRKVGKARQGKRRKIEIQKAKEKRGVWTLEGKK